MAKSDVSLNMVSRSPQPLLVFRTYTIAYKLQLQGILHHPFGMACLHLHTQITIYDDTGEYNHIMGNCSIGPYHPPHVFR